MSEWYYARNGQQQGPVTLEQLQAIARSGDLNLAKDLVWNASMKDWTPASQVPGLLDPPATPAGAPADPANPYAAPQSSWSEAVQATGVTLAEIIPGSEPINVGACVKRGFDLTVRHFSIILLVGVAYFGVSLVAGVLLAGMDAMLGLGEFGSGLESSGGNTYANVRHSGSPLNMLLSQVLSTFLSLGAARIGLNLVSGKPVSVGMLFGEGAKLLRGLLATLLFALLFFAGLILLIVPGIYIALRYGQFIMAIVDRDMGVMDALA